MELIIPQINDLQTYKELEQEFFDHHKKYDTLLQDIDPSKRDLKKEFQDASSEKAE